MLTKALRESPLRHGHLVVSERHLCGIYYTCRGVRRRDLEIAHIVSSGICKHIVQCVCLGDIFSRLAYHDGQFDLVIGEVLVNGLSGLWNSDDSVGTNEAGLGLVKQNRGSVE